MWVMWVGNGIKEVHAASSTLPILNLAASFNTPYDSQERFQKSCVLIILKYYSMNEQLA